MEAYSLIEVNQYIRQVIAVNFQESIWVKAEISQIRESRGAYYLELVEKKENSDEVIANIGAVIWYKAALFIKNKLKDLSPQILREGIHIQCKIKVEFHEKYGLKFSIEDIDPAFTFGQMEMKRQATIEKLNREELLRKNAGIPLPAVIQKIAIISSSKAAGLEDFMNHLHTNRYQYSFQTRLFEASVQGQNQEREIIQALDQAGRMEFDCIVIIRGGGSRLDLSGFDSYLLAQKAALCTLPVLTGIGHETDQTIIELVVHTPLKTPTAVANFIIDHNLHFESGLLDTGDKIIAQVSGNLNRYFQEMSDIRGLIRQLSFTSLEKRQVSIDRNKEKIQFRLEKVLSNMKNRLDHAASLVKFNNPEIILHKGYTMSFQDGKLVKSLHDLSEAEVLITVFSDGKAESKIIKQTKKHVHG